MEARSVAIKGLNRACEVLLQDLEALPEDAFTRRFGGKSRTAADIIHEINLVNDHIAAKMRGEEGAPLQQEGWIVAPPELSSKGAVVDAFRASSANLTRTAESFTEAQMEEPMPTETGETTRFDRCRFLAVHMMYHSGQLNFIQTLLGDDEWHWN